MDKIARLHRASRVFLACLLLAYGSAAPDVLRRMADELEWLAADVEADEGSPESGSSGSGGSPSRSGQAN
jgi:hypothetical protein